jgi:hypothetical protein
LQDFLKQQSEILKKALNSFYNEVEPVYFVSVFPVFFTLVAVFVTMFSFGLPTDNFPLAIE